MSPRKASERADDDATPETLLRPEQPDPADTALTVVPGAAIGAGGGRDEAEDAEADPIAPAELKRLRRRVARSGASLAEPNESRAGSPGRARNR